MKPRVKFWDRMATRYSKQPVADEAAYQQKLETTRAYLRPDMEVFEFGCGTGSTAILHAPLVKHIHAIDISKNMLEIARTRAEAAKVENITFEPSSIDAFPARNDHYDAILGLSILHLLEDRDAAIAKAFQMLRPGGVFVSSTLCLAQMGLMVRAVARITRFFGFLPLVQIFSQNELITSLTTAGFEISHQWEPTGGRVIFIVASKPA